MQKVSIITVNYNNSHVTDALLQSIFATNTYTNIEIIVVDNASKENPVPNWQRQYPNVQFIRSEVNLGFAGGNNVAIKAATGYYFFLVNNDTEFTEGLVETLVNTMNQHPQIGIISPKIKYFDQPETLQYAGYTPMNYFTARNSCIGQFEIDKGQYNHLTGKTGYIHGAAMMVSKHAIDKAGLMAENFFLYYEEIDWCDRIQQQNLEAWVNMNALIFHKESISVGKNSALKEYFMNRNRILFIRKNANFLQQIIFYAYFLLLVVPRNIFAYIKNGDVAFIKQLLKAIWWNCTNKTDSNYLGFTFKTKS